MPIMNLATVKPLILLAHAGEGCFLPFNAAYVRFFRKRPVPDVSKLKGMARFHVEGGPSWSMPTLINKSLVPSELLLDTLPEPKSLSSTQAFLNSLLESGTPHHSSFSGGG
jgi:hypothetical protein